MKNRMNVNGAAASRNGRDHADRIGDNRVAERDMPPFSNYAVDTPLKIDEICDTLMDITDGWPKCVNKVLCYRHHDGTLGTLEDAAELFAWIGGFGSVDWRHGARAVSKEEFFKRLHQRERWAWATPYPHFPPLPGLLYLNEAPKPKNNGMLDKLLNFMLPKTDYDRELIRAFVLTLFWGGPPGKRPQFVVVSDEDVDEQAGRGTGKTTLVQCLGNFVGGCIDIPLGGSDDSIGVLLLSPTSWQHRIALVDNLKSSKFSNDHLEKLITRTEITGRRLYRGFATRPNLLTWTVTVNGAFFSTDMARRSVVIRLDRPSSRPIDWESKVNAFLVAEREAIIADIRWHLEVKSKQSLKVVDTWAAWCLNVLSCCEEPDKLLDHIQGERRLIDSDKEEVALTIDHIRRYLMEALKYTDTAAAAVDRSLVWMPTSWLVEVLRKLDPGLGVRHAQLFLGRLTGSGRIRKHNRKNGRGYLWTGAEVDQKRLPEVIYLRHPCGTLDRR